MSAEPFIMRDEDRALEWVRVFSDSCSVPNEFAAALLASLCGFGSWDVMMFAIESMPASPCDESLPPYQVHQRHLRYIEIMIHDHAIGVPVAHAVAAQISPSSGSPLTRIDALGLLDMLEDEADEMDLDGFEIGELFASVSSDAGLYVMMPLTSELNLTWTRVFDYMGWDHTYLFNDHELTGTPSFVLHDPTEGSAGFPVYLAHSIPPPSFNLQISDFPTPRHRQCACLGDFVTDWAGEGSPGFLLLSAYPQIAQLKGKYYCYIGQMYVHASGIWVDLLLNKACADVWTLLHLNKKVTPELKGASRLSERSDLFGKRIALLLSDFVPGFDEADEYSIVAMETDDYWYVVRGVSNYDYHPDDLEPYLLAPLRKF